MLRRASLQENLLYSRHNNTLAVLKRCRKDDEKSCYHHKLLQRTTGSYRAVTYQKNRNENNESFSGVDQVLITKSYKRTQRDDSDFTHLGDNKIQWMSAEKTSEFGNDRRCGEDG